MGPSPPDEPAQQLTPANAPADKNQQVNALPAVETGTNINRDPEEELLDVDLVFQNLRALLRDSGRFHSLCEAGFQASLQRAQQRNAERAPDPTNAEPVQTVLRTVKELQLALNHICREVKLEDVTMEEAEDLFVANLNSFDFYQLAKPFFESVARSLDEATGNLVVEEGNLL